MTIEHMEEKRLYSNFKTLYYHDDDDQHSNRKAKGKESTRTFFETHPSIEQPVSDFKATAPIAKLP